VRGIEALQMAERDMDMGVACFMQRSTLIYWEEGKVNGPQCLRPFALTFLN